MTNFSVESLCETISKQLKEVLEEEADKIIKASVIEYEKRIRKEITSIVLTIHRFLSVEKHNDNLVITIKREDIK